MNPNVHLIPAAWVCLLIVANVNPAQAAFTRITTGPVVTDGADGQGCAWVDFNNDGLLDLFVSCNRTGQNLLYRNDGQGVFTKITSGTIPSSGGGAYSASWADMDNDGRLDLFISKQNGSPSLLFHQEDDGSFTRTSVPTGGSVSGSAWADANNDGFVDLCVADPTQDILWQNDGRGHLENASEGPKAALRVGQGVWADYDNDGYLDLIMTSGAAPGGCRVFRNNGQGKFTEVTATGLEQATFGTGMAWGDYDNDGFPDVFVSRLNSNFTEPLPSFLFHNNGNGTFTQVEQAPFTDDTGFSPSCSWGDYDNDGWLDLIVSNFGNGGNNRLYHNNGDGTFTRVGSGSIADDLGSSAGCIWGDYDRDGFLDLFISNAIIGGGEANDFLYHNDGNTNAWLAIKCVGTRSNRSAIGAVVRLQATIGGKTVWQRRDISTGSGLNQNALEAHFGLGGATNAETVRIEWPSGTVQVLPNVPAKQLLTVTEPARLRASVSGGATQVLLQGGRNIEYDIQTSTNLAVWSVLSTTTITNLEGAALVTDTNMPRSSRLFYRAVLH